MFIQKVCTKIFANFLMYIQKDFSMILFKCICTKN